MSDVARLSETPSVDAAAIYQTQHRFFSAGHTLSRAFREGQLRALQAEIMLREDDVADALYADLHKSPFEAYGSETGFVLAELRHMIKHLSAWMKPTKHIASLMSQPGRSVIHPQPLGVNLIMGAWNYPFHLTLLPLVGAIAAGNTAVVKPPELASATSGLISEILGKIYSPEYVACVEGGVDVATDLLAQPWDHIFYTGGGRVGRIVMRAAAEHLSRVTLELGGKSPTVVLSSARIKLAARRIVRGKFLNCGQTCVAPDYLLVHEDVEQQLIRELKVALVEMFGEDPQRSPDYGRMINEHHTRRVAALIDDDKVAHGGRVDLEDRFIAPTVLQGVGLDDPAMGEEIFGPVLPILTVRSAEDAIDKIARNPHPLALYLFTEDAAEQRAVVSRVSFGGGAINNTIMQMGDPQLPFGGIKSSGMGAYHGKHSFDVFTHYKSVLEANSSPWLDLPVLYAPFEGRLPLIKKILG